MRKQTRREMAVKVQVELAQRARRIAAAQGSHHAMMSNTTDAAFGYLPQPGGRALALPHGHAPSEYNRLGLGGYLPSQVDRWWD